MTSFESRESDEVTPRAGVLSSLPRKDFSDSANGEIARFKAGRREASEGNARRGIFISKKNARKDESEPRVVDVLARLGRATVRPRISRNFERSSSLGRSVRSTRAFVNRNETVKNAVRLVGVADAFVSSLPTALRDPPRPRAFDPRSASPRPFPHAPLKDHF